MKLSIVATVAAYTLVLAGAPNAAQGQNTTSVNPWQVSVAGEYVNAGDEWFLEGPGFGVRTSLGYTFSEMWVARIGVGVGHHYNWCNTPDALFGYGTSCGAIVLPSATIEVLHLPSLSNQFFGIVGGRTGVFGSSGDVWFGGGFRLGIQWRPIRGFGIESGLTGDRLRRWKYRNISPWTTRNSLFLGDRKSVV